MAKPQKFLMPLKCAVILTTAALNPFLKVKNKTFYLNGKMMTLIFVLQTSSEFAAKKQLQYLSIK